MRIANHNQQVAGYAPAREASPGREPAPGREAAPGRAEEGSQAPFDKYQQRVEAREVQALRARDREVRTHEQAHKAAGGRYVTGGIRFDYQRGPDGRQYAVGGEVSISTSAVAGDPEATLRKMEVVRRAALAPAEPSAQDLQVAAQATATANQARLEVARQRSTGYGEGDGSTPATRAYGAVSGVGAEGVNPVLNLIA